MKIRVGIFAALIITSFHAQAFLFSKTLTFQVPTIRGQIDSNLETAQRNKLKLHLEWECVYIYPKVDRTENSCGIIKKTIDLDSSGQFSMEGFSGKFKSPRSNGKIYFKASILEGDEPRHIRFPVLKNTSEKGYVSEYDDSLSAILPKKLKKIFVYSLPESSASWKLKYAESMESFFQRYPFVQVGLYLRFDGFGNGATYSRSIESTKRDLPKLQQELIAASCDPVCPEKIIATESIDLFSGFSYIPFNTRRSFEVRVNDGWPSQWKELTINNDDSLERFLSKIQWQIGGQGSLNFSGGKINISRVNLTCNKGVLSGHFILANNSKVILEGLCGESLASFRFTLPPNTLSNVSENAIFLCDRYYHDTPNPGWLTMNGKPFGYFEMTKNR